MEESSTTNVLLPFLVKVLVCILLKSYHIIYYITVLKELWYNTNSMYKDFTDKVYILEGPDGSGKTTLG